VSIWRKWLKTRLWQRVWTAVIAASVLALFVAAFAWPQSFRLTTFSDVLQCVLLISATISFLPRAVRAQGRLRLFWMFLSLGAASWGLYQFFWTYIEVVQHSEVPAVFSGDIILFLHLVPMMAAVAVRPHVARDEYGARVGRLDFAILIVWWLYLYAFSVLPWQYVVLDGDIYNQNLNAVYLTEKLALLAILLAFWVKSEGRWKFFYANFFGANLLYAASSYIANWALARNDYYSGSYYDIPLCLSMAWLTLIGLWTPVREPQIETRNTSSIYGVWVARCGMIAAISLPLFAAWVMLDTAAPPRIRAFRLVLTLLAAFGMGIMAFERQRSLDRQLHSLLQRSQDSLVNLKDLQAQVVQSAKQASIGQLVGGAAHELNNPITAMLGYSELLMNTQLTPHQHNLAAKIGQQVRRTRSLVASLLSFARQRPASRTPLDINTLVRTAVKLTEAQWQALKIEVRSELDSDLPKVLGDSNQLLQVCCQMIGNALHQMEDCGSRKLVIRSWRKGEIALLELREDAPLEPRSADFASEAIETGDALGLSACQGIVQEHFGQIVSERRADGGITLRIELPASPLPDRAATRSSALLAQSQPSA
jgi:signal transduction histidine kinase